ncbi:oxygen-independent coproporphyrinogen III oxidase [Arthrospiribacter ruber]|uniref:Coproporphyrinogen-III oxidase n=1 Tax=Arthrospiribacter ruber TaxID=2487934 RepID=A0A951J144_9BACT|nr:oxygen-independent coproporphyrinogen III oxidase [Arthrospiribacter ruber]MBW3468918.1 oxygen-independent coproporphyrinogen III oxidase [Arthrospiribacter ruber]
MNQRKASLVEKYNIPAPRYTSYPTVPLWSNDLSGESWNILVKKAFDDFNDSEGVTLYIHLPYCESLCTYCGCNKRITKNHQVEIPYIDAVIEEWKHYLEIFGKNPNLSGIHLGGGTPTFFSPESLQKLLGFIRDSATVLPHAEFSFEGHPNNTTREHLQTLYNLGFRRVSYGIQDFDLEVQKTIHRIQTFEKVKEATELAREIGYTSVNFDLIYGLPHQNMATITDTFSKVASLKPDRIAYYSYAHLPSVFKAQKSFEAFLPNETEKRRLYEKGKEILSDMGYFEIGMDHFAVENEPLYEAKLAKKLHRNFMGYTTSPSRVLIGLGNSSISDIYYAYGQNDKNIDTYKQSVLHSQSPIQKGHVMSETDLHTKSLILDLICNHSTDWSYDFFTSLNYQQLEKLNEYQMEGLINYSPKGLEILKEGIPFIRIICMTFDQRMMAKSEKQFGFSKAI